MLTDPNCPGTEKLAVSAIKPELLTCPHMPVRLSEITAEKTDSLPPMSLFLVKGWSRCVAMTACLLHAYESESGVFEAPSRYDFCVRTFRYCSTELVILTLDPLCHYYCEAWPDELKRFLGTTMQERSI